MEGEAARKGRSTRADAPLSSRVERRLIPFETAILAGGVALFLVLLYTMARGPAEGAFLNPPLIAAALAILLWPLRNQRAVRSLLIAAGFLLFFWFLDVLSGILAPFVVVYVLAYLFDPLVSEARLRYSIPRAISSLIVTLLFVGLVVLVVLLIVPQLFRQIEDLLVRLLDSATQLRQWLATTTLFDDLEAQGLVNKEEVTRQLTELLQTRVGSLADQIPVLAERLFGYLTSILGLITILAIIPVILYYTLKDYPWIKARLVELFPTFGGQRGYLVRAGGVVGNYLRGQLTISAIAAFNVSVALSIFRVPYALIIGLLAGVLNLIPNLGAIITNVLAVALMLIFGREPWYRDVVIVLIVLGAQGLLEQAVLTPKILSHHVGLHPVLILLSLFAFGAFLGLIGLIIAVPVTALVMTFYKSYREGLTLELASAKQATGSGRRAWRRRFGRRSAGQETESPGDEGVEKENAERRGGPADAS